MARVLNTGVNYTRPEVSRLVPIWDKIADCIEGQDAVKRRKTAYLPRPNPEDLSTENELRYSDYLTRAVFYNFTRRTLMGLLGQVFVRSPQIDLPPEIEALNVDATGSGISLEQFAHKTVMETLAFGRCGILADYPDVVGVTTKAQLDAGEVRPALLFFGPKEIRNWRTITIGARIMLSLVVLAEDFTTHDDGFELKQKKQFRVLRLVSNLPMPDPTTTAMGDEAAAPVGSQFQYVVEIWREAGGWNIAETYTPKDASGKPFDHIPFTFVGPINNDSNPDYPPLYDLAELNVAHYRNSADYEEALYLVGQPTLAVSGLTEEWFTKVLNGRLMLGSRGGISLPVGASAAILQVSPNTMPKEGMEAKERQAVALGAKLVEQVQVQRTATEAGLEDASEKSTLSQTAKNAAEAILWALQEAARFVTTAQPEIKFELNTEFDLMRLSPDERKQLIAEWQQGAITFDEMRASLRRGGIATEDDATAKTKIDAEQSALMEKAAQAAQMADPNDPGENKETPANDPEGDE